MTEAPACAGSVFLHLLRVSLTDGRVEVLIIRCFVVSILAALLVSGSRMAPTKSPLIEETHKLTWENRMAPS